MASRSSTSMPSPSDVSNHEQANGKPTTSPKQPCQIIDSGHEETDEDRSPHAQPPARLSSTDSEIKSEPAVHSIEESKKPATNVLETAEADEDPTEVILHETDYYSDDDIDEENDRLRENVQGMTNSEKRVWEANRARANFEAGKPKHFECFVHLLGDAPCQNLQEYLSTRTGARTVVSSFFGHNKTEWNQIVKRARVHLCRKHYQVYETKTKNHLAPLQLVLCRAMLDKIEQWRPDCRFLIQLTKAMSQKITEFYEQIHAGLSEQEAAAKIDALEAKGKTEAARRVANTPVLFAVDLQNRYRGDGKTVDDVRAVFNWLETKLADGTIKHLPAFEALLEARPEDRENLRIEQKRRSAALKERLLPVPANMQKRRVHALAPAMPPPVRIRPADREATPTPGPSKPGEKFISPSPLNLTDTVARVKLPHKFAAISINEKPSTSPVESSASEHARLSLNLFRAAADFITPEETETDDEKSSNNADPFISAVPSTRPTIKLNLGGARIKGKAPIRAGFVADDLESRVIKKRKQNDVSLQNDDGAETERARPIKKLKRAQVIVEADQAVGTGNAEIQQTNVVQGARKRLVSFIIGDVKVIIDIEPVS